VNVQDMANFDCQVLNRDHWKHEPIRTLIKDSFIFLQYVKGDPGASQFIQYYLPEGKSENPDNFPYVAIVDPRTGEQVKVWLGRPFPGPDDLLKELREFLNRYSLAANSKNPVAKAKPQKPTKDVDKMTEEEMLEMALQNSLETAGGSSTKPSLHDPDQLTASMHEDGKGKERADEGIIDLSTPEPTPDTSLVSVFSRIPSDRPHQEPPNDPATTTRIRFRHPNGQIVRRFALTDPVQRIYEWLKASPIEGKEGVEFELKRPTADRSMPAGSLIENLQQTIQDADLKQAVVMVDFVED
jgi:UBX domain-containing protein 7